MWLPFKVNKLPQIILFELVSQNGNANEMERNSNVIKIILCCSMCKWTLGIYRTMDMETNSYQTKKEEKKCDAEKDSHQFFYRLLALHCIWTMDSYTWDKKQSFHFNTRSICMFIQRMCEMNETETSRTHKCYQYLYFRNRLQQGLHHINGVFSID